MHMAYPVLHPVCPSRSNPSTSTVSEHPPQLQKGHPQTQTKTDRRQLNNMTNTIFRLYNLILL